MDVSMAKKYILITTFCLLTFMVPTLAHEALSGWKYDSACCSEKDCYEIPVSKTPRITPHGYVMHDGTFVPKDSSRRRDSKDVRWHRCDGYTIAGPVAIPFVRCLYVPQGGF
jgi:hypothetical protein